MRTSLTQLSVANHKAFTMYFATHSQLAGLLMCCWLWGNTTLAQTPEPTTIKYPDATASEEAKAAFVQALEKCQTEVREDYASKMAKAVADGKSHLVAVYERRREATLVSLCQLTADNAALDQRIAAADQRIAANRADIAANIALSGLYSDAKRIADKVTSNTATPKDVADLELTYQSLKSMNTTRPNAGTVEVIQLLEGLLTKYKRLQ